MDVNEAVSAAKSFIRDVYRGAGESVTDLTLEAIKRDDQGWLVTIGFSRPVEGTDLVARLKSARRDRKLLEVEPDGTVNAMIDA